MRRITFKLTFLLLLLLAHSALSFGQSISIGTIEEGSYGKGSGISVPIKIDDPEGKLATNNVFKLFLSDASGSFSNEVQIGQYAGFYTTFINGSIPNTISTGGNYKVRIKSSSPAIVSDPSENIALQAVPGLTAAIDATNQTVSSNPRVFGFCPGGRSNARFTFTNTSSPGAEVQAVITNELVAGPKTTLSFASETEQFTAGLAHYTILVKAKANGVIATQSYFLINNISNTAFSTTGNNTVCLPVGILEYGVETVSPTGIQVNFPGNTYRVNWGDGTIETYTLNKIRSLNSKVKHTYVKSSCGSQISVGSIKYYNVFGIEIQTFNPYCNAVGTPINTQAKVVQQPVNNFTLPVAGCTNAGVNFSNSSIPGENPSATSPTCANNNVVYNWYVDDVLIAKNKPLSFAGSYVFTVHGLHRVRLESISNSECQADPIEKTICIQDPPEPSFTLPGNLFCLSETVKPTDKSVIDANCNTGNVYQWTVTGPAPVAYVNDTKANSKEPVFAFTKPGIYKIKLGINTASCGLVNTDEQTIIVNEKPSIIANWQSNLCGKGQLLTFGNAAGNPVATTLNGTFQELSDTYTWSISGGAFEFRNNTSANSKAPQILFSDFGTYTISIVHKNNCGTETISRQLKFNESPTVSAGEDKTICAGASIPLNGSINGTAASFTWVGGTGTFSPSRNVLNPVYMPSTAEIAAGQVQLKLSVVTNNPAPCNQVEDIVAITLNPPNKITSASAKAICTGNALQYQPTATVANSTFSWTATGTSNASGFSASGTGTISDILLNTDKNANATVTYTIIPASNGCNGEPFAFTVTVTPLPAVALKAANAAVCTGQAAQIQLLANVTGMKCIWTSTPSANVTGSSNQLTAKEANAIGDVLVNNSNTPGSVTYTVIPVSIAGCTGEPATVTVEVSPAPVKADAGRDQNLCSTGTAQLSGNNPGLGTGKWSLTSNQTEISFNDASRTDATVTGLKPGETYIFRWTISGPGGCTASFDEVQIKVLSPVSNNNIVYSNGAVCAGSSVTINGTVATGADGNYIYNWETSLDAENWSPVNIKEQQNLQVVVNNTAYFRRKATSGECFSLSNIVKVDVQPGIGNNVVTADQTVCLNTKPLTLTGKTPTGADGSYAYQWQQSTDGINWANIPLATGKDYQPLANNKTTSYRRIVTSTICTGEQQSLSNAVKITVNTGALAVYTWKNDTGCAPFAITAQNIVAELSDNNGEYKWYVKNQLIGTGASFPGYTISAAGQTADIRLEAVSKAGCGTVVYSHTFSTASAIKAEFTASALQGCGPLTVKFSNATVAVPGISYSWDFGNGQTSSVQNPSQVIFNERNDGKDTIYTVKLKAVTSCGISEKTLGILVKAKPISVFSPDKTTGCSPFKVSFTNSTPGSGNVYNWDFGDGKTLTTSDNSLVSHIYTTAVPKTFTVKLKVVGQCGTDASEYVIKVNPNSIAPQLVINGDELEGCAPHPVHFSNNSKGATFYNWDFGDGTTLQTNRSPETILHTFTKGGKYTVKMNASNGCSDTTLTQVITVYPQPVIKFTADAVSGCSPLTVQFKNQTTNGYTYRWEFSDGTQSTLANPVHTFDYAHSPYTVRLIATTALGCPDTLEMKDYIVVAAPPVAKFEVGPDSVIRMPRTTFSFTDKSQGDIVSWKWEFGDKGTSKLKNPEHNYSDTGKYIVRLTITTRTGCTASYSRTVQVKGFQGTLFLPNAFIPNSATEELRIYKAKGSGIKQWHMRIFNKWGQVVWETKALDYKGAPVEGWDGNLNGSPAPQGLYVWEIEATFENDTKWEGVSTNNTEPKRTGGIYLIR